MIDRWLHYERSPVAYGYVVVDPIAEVARAASTISYLLGTWAVLWHERKTRYSLKQQAVWWFVANLTAFVVILLSIYYVALHLALAVAWLQFLKLNIIDDVATKRNHFKVTMSVANGILGLFILLGAIDTYRKARVVDGPGASRKVSRS